MVLLVHRGGWTTTASNVSGRQITGQCSFKINDCWCNGQALHHGFQGIKKDLFRESVSSEGVQWSL